MTPSSTQAYACKSSSSISMTPLSALHLYLEPIPLTNSMGPLVTHCSSLMHETCSPHSSQRHPTLPGTPQVPAWTSCLPDTPAGYMCTCHAHLVCGVYGHSPPSSQHADCECCPDPAAGMEPLTLPSHAGPPVTGFVDVQRYCHGGRGVRPRWLQ